MSKQTILYHNHVERGAKMVSFGGYSLPVWFSSLKEEHLSVRHQVGVFDISHMGVLKISGKVAKSFLQYISCNDIEKTVPHKMIYSMILNHEGMVLDDIMVGALHDEFVMVVNASNRQKLLAWFEQLDTESPIINNLEDSHAFFALQGPAAIALLESVTGDPVEEKRFSVWHQTIQGAPCIAMRTGYTGEDGVELVVPFEHAQKLWERLILAGAKPCGLGARDTLRLESGLPLYGQELSESIHPFMTRYKWVVKFNTPFVGKENLLQLKEKVQEWTTVGLEVLGKGIIRTGYPVIEGGKVSSGSMSPSLGKAIGMAMVKTSNATEGTILHVDVRGKVCPVKVVGIPFIKK